MAGFTLTAVFVGLICYTLGLLFGMYVNRSTQKIAIREAFKRGEETAEIRHAAEKQELSKELLARLEQMKESLVSTYEAYEDAVRTVDNKLSPGARERLTLSSSSTALLSSPAVSMAGESLQPLPSALEDSVYASSRSTAFRETDNVGSSLKKSVTKERSGNGSAELGAESHDSQFRGAGLAGRDYIERDYTYAATENLAIGDSKANG